VTAKRKNMEEATPPKVVKTNRILPYLAVFQAEAQQTLRSWIYRAWVFLSVGAAVGYLFYRFGARQVAGIVQPVSEMMSDMLTWTVLGSITLIIALTAGTICADRGTMADSVLSRGISRYQYFMGKWHARLAVVLGTYIVMALAMLIGGIVLLHGQGLSISGSLLALGFVASLLLVVITFSVSASAVANTTLISLVVVWIVLHAGGFVLSWLPPNYPSPDRALRSLPHIIRGQYDLRMLGELIGASLLITIVTAFAGMIYFSRKDV